MRQATWSNGKRRLTGSYDYIWASDTFVIELDSRDRLTGRRRRFSVVGGDHPEWGRWKLERPPTKSVATGVEAQP